VRENWDSAPPALHFERVQLTSLIQPAFPGATVVDSAPTQGGLANANYRLVLAGRKAPLLIRFFVREPQAAGREVALVDMLAAGRARVLPYIHVAADNPFTGHPYAVREWAEGERLDVVARDMTDAAIADVGRSVGAALARIHAVTFDRTGFLDASLQVAQPAAMGRDGLLQFLKQCLVEGRGAQRIDAGFVESLLAFVARAGTILDDWAGDACLVHSDFGGSNILVRRAAGCWEVASILDWEFAFSGTPFFDFGNLLRPPLGERPGFEAAVVAGYRAAGGRLPDNWRPMSLLLDLYSWAEFLNRPQATPALIADAKAMMERTIALV
jgi:aminoglycoside phosphotransferase (APT) family kinase protein